MPQIEVTFDIDADGILNVSAKDLGTGKEQKIEIKGGSGLSTSPRSSRWSRTPSRTPTRTAASASSPRRATLAENAAYQAEKQLEELGDQVDADAKSEIESAISDVRGVLESDDADEIKAKTDALQAAFHKVSDQIYQAAQQQAAAGGDGAAGDGAVRADGAGAEAEEEVVDAEVVDDDRS